MFGIGVPELGILVIGGAFWVGIAWLLWKVFLRTGMNPMLSLLIFVPYAGVFIVLYLLAFAVWPALAAHNSAPASPNAGGHDSGV